MIFSKLFLLFFIVSLPLLHTNGRGIRLPSLRLSPKSPKLPGKPSGNSVKSTKSKFSVVKESVEFIVNTIGDPLETAQLLYELSNGSYYHSLPNDESSGERPFQLRSKWTSTESSPCLDGGWRTERSVYTAYANAECPPNRQLRWRFHNGQLSLSALDHLDGDRSCLNCVDRRRDCHLKVTTCTFAVAEQKFLLETVHSSGVRSYFRIRSLLHPSRCVSMTTANVTVDECVFDPSQCTAPATHYCVDGECKTERQTALPTTAKRFPQLCFLFHIGRMNRFRCERTVFRLEECQDSEFQLFYVI